MLEGGKATKRTRFGKTLGEQRARTLTSSKLCEKASLRYHVIDAEWRWNYPLSSEVSKLVLNSRSVITVFTFSSRHMDSLHILRRTLSKVTHMNNVAVNLVAGNIAYLDWRERMRPIHRSLRDLVVFARSNFPTMEIFIGTEGISQTAAELASQHDLTPFLLYDRQLEQALKEAKAASNRGRVAVYLPYYISDNYQRLLPDVLRRLAGYILRRRWVQRRLKELGYDVTLPLLRSASKDVKPLPKELITGRLGDLLREAANSLSVYGNKATVIEKLRTLRKLGCSLVVGLPIKENEEQVLRFGSCVKNAQN